MRRRRALDRDVAIPPIRHTRRRRRCQAQPREFLRYYFPEVFFNPFTADQIEMIDTIAEVMTNGGRRGKAAPRGDGKSSISCGLICWAISYGIRQFPVIIGPNQEEADARREMICHQYDTNPQLGEDFPEICTPIRALEGAPQRQQSQTVAAQRTHLKWSGRYIVFPTIQGSLASGSIFTARGIDGAIRGMMYQSRRPDFVLLDDIETSESVRSETETAKIDKKLESDIPGLAGQNRSIALVMLCTIMRRGCLADLYTDRAQRPAWNGQRYKLLQRLPLREDLWNEYVELRRAAALSGDPHARVAHAFYLAHRTAMDDGAIVSNPHRFDGRELPDGSRLQVSTLQMCYDIIADTGGWDAFRTEYQNEPPAEEEAETLRIPARHIQHRITGRPRGVCPADPAYITAGVDIGGRQVHWNVVAWQAAAAHVIDYGTVAVPSPMEGRLNDPDNQAALEAAIQLSLAELRDAFDAGWPDEETGDIRHLDCCLIDSGWPASQAAVFQLSRSDPRRYRAAKGFGTGSGQARYRQPATKGRGQIIGQHWFARRQPKWRARLYSVDADYWKSWVHAALLAPIGEPGSLQLFGDSPNVHREYANHLIAEMWTREWRIGKGWVEFWDQRSRHNHWLDATSLAAAAASILGLQTVGPAPPAGAAALGNKAKEPTAPATAPAPEPTPPSTPPPPPTPPPKKTPAAATPRGPANPTDRPTRGRRFARVKRFG